MAETIDWLGATGKTYRYWFLEGEAKAEPGNYMFVKPSGNGWVPVYIGQSSNLRNRLANHPEMPCVRRNGGTHTMAHTTPGGKQTRLDEEADLVDHWKPACNDT